MPLEPGTVAPRLTFPARELFLQATLILILIALIGVFGQNRRIQTEQGASEQRGYKNRAVICDMIAGLGLHEGRECADPNIQHYRDKTAATTGTTGARNSKTTLNAVCHLAMSLRVTVPECDPAG